MLLIHTVDVVCEVMVHERTVGLQLTLRHLWRVLRALEQHSSRLASAKTAMNSPVSSQPFVILTTSSVVDLSRPSCVKYAIPVLL